MCPARQAIVFHSHGGTPDSNVQLHEERWAHIRFKVWDAPTPGAPFRERLESARRALLQLASPASDRIHVVQATPCEDAPTVQRLLTRIESFGGEGLVLRRADSHFKPGKPAAPSPGDTLIKVKSKHDAEAKVLAHNGGMESLHCLSFETGTRFDLTAGSRARMAPVGAVVTYKYEGITKSGTPRFASLLREHPLECDCHICAVPEERWPKPVPSLEAVPLGNGKSHAWKAARRPLG